MASATPSPSKNRSPSKPLSSLSSAQQNFRTAPISPTKRQDFASPTKTDSLLFSPIKYDSQSHNNNHNRKDGVENHGKEYNDDGGDLFDITTSSMTTKKTSHSMTIVNGEVVREEHSSEFDAGKNGEEVEVDVDFEDTGLGLGTGVGGVESSPFREDVTMDISAANAAAAAAAASRQSPSKRYQPMKEHEKVEEEEEGHDENEEGDDSIIHHDLHDNEATQNTTTAFDGTKDQSGGNANAGDETEMTIDIGDLSTFSAVPNVDMTMFAGLRGGPSPTKTGAWSPSKQLRNSYFQQTPATAKRGGASPRKNDSDEEDVDVDVDATPRRPAGGDATDLLNFTGQTDIFIPPPQQSATRTSRRSPSGRGAFPVRVSPTKSQAQIDRERASFQPRGPAMDFSLETPSRAKRDNLLDLDIDPLPTPRSVPTITPRELESLRSELTSQISGLRATLSGKEAEVSALKRAITEAEARCGTALEDVRHEKAKVETLENDREGWNKRQVEMEGILRDVRQEVLVRTRDAEKADRKVEEMERKVGDWEGRNRELEAQVETLRRRVAAAATATATGAGEVGEVTMKLMDVDAAVKDATERVARELHSLYKGKHETKVAALKKSYEGRWEKRVKELESQLKDSQEDLLQLKTEHDATLSGPLRPSQASEAEKEKLREESEALEAEKKMLEARISGLESELASTKEESEIVRSELEKQRSENGELVAAVDAMLQLQDEINVPATASSSPSKSSHHHTLQHGLENLRGSISRSSHPHPYTASTPRSAIKTRTPGAVNTTGLGLKLPQPSSRATGIPTSASGMGFSGESRIGRAPGRVGGRGRSRSGSRTRIGGGGTAAGLREGIARMGAGR